jgi:integrase
MPKRATARPVVVDVDVKSPYQRIAVELRSQILDGTLVQGLPLPTIKQLASTHGVSVPTAKRAVDLLASWGYVSVVPGQRTLVRSFSVGPEHDTAQEYESDQPRVPPARAERNGSVSSLDLEVRHLGKVAGKLRTAAYPEDSDTLHRLLVQAIRRGGGDVTEIGDYELIVRHAGTDEVVATYVAAAP